MTRLSVATRTDVGQARDHNEDTVGTRRLDAWDAHLLVVADGMGGHAAGDIASGAAAETFMDRVVDVIGETSTVGDALDAGVTAANRQLADLVADRPHLDGMGTTLVAGVVSARGDASFVNVGDSRAYLIGDGINQLTTDQTLVRELVEEGTVDPDEADEHPQRHVLSQALGTTTDVDPAFTHVDIGGGTVLLCSDGLSEEVPDDRIRAIVTKEPDVESAADKLVRAANANGGSDNVSVVLAERR
jgi:protein phosphatase